MRRILIASVVVVVPLLLSAQVLRTCSQIEASAEYHHARSQAKTEKEAKMNAQTFLVQQLSSLVTSRTDMTINADNNSSEQQFYNLSKTISNLRLDGLQFMTCKDEDVKKKKNQGENDEV